MLISRARPIVGVFLLCGTSAWAQNYDVIKYRAGVSVMSNDNFFSTPVAAVSELVTSQTLGVNIALPVSLQQFEFDANITSNQYQTNANFDNVAQNFSAAWRWSITPQLHGDLTSTHAESLNSTADSLTPNLRNKNTTQHTILSTAYEIGGPWQLTAGAANLNSVNEQALTGQSNQPDNRSIGVDAGVRFVTGSGNSLAYSLQRASGTSTNDYTSTTQNIAFVWVLSGNSSVNGHVAYLDQHFGAAPQFDFSGAFGSTMFNWRASGKLSVSAGWQRDLASYQIAGTTFTQTDTFSITPAWQISPKSSIRIQYRDGIRSDHGSPFGAFALREDRMHDTLATFSWQPSPLATISTTLGEAYRTSSFSNLNYTSHTVGFSALLNF